VQVRAAGSQQRRRDLVEAEDTELLDPPARHGVLLDLELLADRLLLGGRCHGSSSQDDASPQGRAGRMRYQDAGSLNSSAIGATEDAVARRPARPGGSR